MIITLRDGAIHYTNNIVFGHQCITFIPLDNGPVKIIHVDSIRSIDVID
jgi:hypothetical protein